MPNLQNSKNYLLYFSSMDTPFEDNVSYLKFIRTQLANRIYAWEIYLKIFNVACK